MSNLIKRSRHSIESFKRRNLGIPQLSRDEIIKPTRLDPPSDQATKEFLRRIPFVDPPIAQGVAVKAATLHGFLAAMAENPSYLDYESNMHDDVRFTYSQSEGVLLLEARRHGVWLKIAIKGSAVADQSFDAVVSGRRAANIAGALSAEQEMVIIGADPKGLGIGSYSLPYSKPVDEFPVEPVIHPPIVRIAFPRVRLESVVNSVLSATEPHGWSDFFPADTTTLHMIERQDGFNLGVSCGKEKKHFLYIPYARVQVESFDTIVTGVSVSSWLFNFLLAIADGDWVGMEIQTDGLVARGNDYFIIAPGTVHTPTMPTPEIPEFPSDMSWVVSKEDLLDKARLLLGPCWVSLDRNLLVIKDKSSQTTHYVNASPEGKDRVSTRRVYLGEGQLRSAVKACPTDVVRIGYKQERSRDGMLLSLFLQSSDTNYIAKLEDEE